MKSLKVADYKNPSLRRYVIMHDLEIASKRADMSPSHRRALRAQVARMRAGKRTARAAALLRAALLPPITEF